MKKKMSYRKALSPAIIGFPLAFVCLMFIALLFVHPKMEWQGPDSGLWYCKELQMQLCCQPGLEYVNPGTGEVDTRSYALIDGECVMCDVRNNKGARSLYVINQEPADISHLGDKLFEGEFVSLDADQYVVCRKGGDNYTFNRVAEFSLDEKRNDYKEQIGGYSGAQTVEKAPHIEIAVQQAKELWQTQLGIDTTDIEATVEVDLENSCWFVSASLQNAPMALIEMNGNVLCVWIEKT